MTNTKGMICNVGYSSFLGLYFNRINSIMHCLFIQPWINNHNFHFQASIFSFFFFCISVCWPSKNSIHNFVQPSIHKNKKEKKKTKWKKCQQKKKKTKKLKHLNLVGEWTLNLEGTPIFIESSCQLHCITSALRLFLRNLLLVRSLVAFLKVNINFLCFHL